MLKRVAVALLLVALLTVGAAFSGSQSEETITPEEFAAFFQICCRPPVITKDHLRYIEELVMFEGKTIGALREAVPITTVEQLEAVEGIGPKRSFILQALFNLSAEAKPTETGLEKVIDRVEALGTQLQKLSRAIDDLRDEVGDLEDRLEELEDNVEQIG